MSSVRIRSFARSLILTLIIFPGFVLAVDPMVGELEDPHKHLVSNLINEFDGEQHNLQTGELGYYRDDFVFEGNGPTIRLGRKFYREFGYPFVFKNMSLELPRVEYRLHGEFFQYLTVCGGGGECGPDYRNPPIVDNICSGLKMYDVGRRLNGGDGDPYYWEYDQGDLTSGIKFTVHGQSINLFPKESILAQTTRFPTNAEYVSPDNWYARCSGSTWIIHSPDGYVYNLNEYEQLPATHGATDGKVAVLISSIVDPYGRSLTYSYATRLALVKVGARTGPFGFTTNGNGADILGYGFNKKYLTDILASDDRKLSVIYNSDNTVKYIEGNSPENKRRLDYSYGGSDDRAYLHRVTQQDNTFWQYSFLYGQDLPPGKLPVERRSSVGHIITQIKTPHGLTIDYQQEPDDPRKHTELASCHLNYAQSYQVEGSDGPFQIVLKQRKLSGPGLENIQSGMEWNYEYHELNSGDRSATFVSGPGNSSKHTFRRINYFDGPSDTEYVDNGKLLSTSVYPYGTSYGAASNPVKTVSTSWIKRPAILNENAINSAASIICGSNEINRPQSVWALSYHNAMRRVPGSTSTTIDGKIFTKTYSNYDGFDNAQSLTETGNAGVRTTDFTYHYDSSNWIIGRLKDETVTGGGPGIQRSFNSYGQLASEKKHGLSTRTYSYYPPANASAGQLSLISWQRDGLVLEQQFQDYYRGISRRELDPDGNVITRVINANGTVLSQTDANGNPTSFTYDSLLRIDTIDTPLYATSDTNWSNSGRIRTTTQGNNRITENFDALGRSINTTEVDLSNAANNSQTLTSYDSVGRVSYQSLPKITSESTSIGMLYTYDDLNRIKTLTHTGDSSVTNYCYRVADCGFASGRLDFGYAMTDARSFYTVYNFEAYGDPSDRRLKNIHDTTGVTATFDRLTSVGRNIYGDITSVTRGGTTRSYIYSTTYPRLVQDVIEPETGTTTYAYRSDGTLKNTKSGASGLTQYSHNKNGQVTLINYPGTTPDVINSYYPNGELETSVSDNISWDYQLNTENDLEQETLSVDGLTFATIYGRDALGYIDSITYPSGRIVNRGIDALGRTRSIANYITAVDYFPNGQLEKIDYINGQTTTISQSNKHYPEQFKTVGNGSTLVDMTYDYDPNNNIKTITDPNLGNKTLGYDGVNRLVSAQGAWGTGSIAYDANDNITQKTIGAENLIYGSYGANNRLTGISGSKTYSFAYDLYGNVTDNGTDTFTYNDANQLTSSGTNSYRYDAHNRRVKVTRGADIQYYVYTSNGQLSHRYNPTTNQTTDYIQLNGKLIARIDKGMAEDGDNDGIPDVIENLNGLDSANAADALADADGDGLSNLQEFQLGTSLTTADTDGDGMTDGYEVSYGLDPKLNDASYDNDGDSLTNYQEFLASTNPNNADTDGDGIADNLDPDPNLNIAALIVIVNGLILN